MVRKRRVFDKEFKKQVVGLILDKGQSASQVATDLDIKESVIRRWVQQYQEDPRQASEVGLHALGSHDYR